jgi:hypothetical protein
MSARTLSALSLLGTLIALASLPSQATPIRYDFTLTVETADACSSPSPLALPCADPGTQFFGSFTTSTDVSGLADGLYSLIPLDAWRLEIGDIVWDMNLPYPLSDFGGFRDPALGGINPGLLVSSGTVTGFLGGVYGSGDVPFVDFDSVSGPSRFRAFAGGTGLEGRYAIQAVPEPGVFGLLLVSLAAIGMFAFARSRA